MRKLILIGCLVVFTIVMVQVMKHISFGNNTFVSGLVTSTTGK